MKEITLKFDLNTGEAHVEASGFKGQGCKKATEFIGKALGETKDFKMKAEWYETNLELSGTVNSNLCG